MDPDRFDLAGARRRICQTLDAPRQRDSDLFEHIPPSSSSQSPTPLPPGTSQGANSSLPDGQVCSHTHVISGFPTAATWCSSSAATWFKMTAVVEQITLVTPNDTIKPCTRRCCVTTLLRGGTAKARAPAQAAGRKVWAQPSLGDE